MEIETNYAVKLFFSNPSFIQIYFETIANALDAEASEVLIHISTDGQISPTHFEITVKDNGQGFTDERFDRFARLKKPTDAYHKGLGRLVYLHYFSEVHVESVFNDKKRTFLFSESFRGKSKVVQASKSDQPGTILRFRGFIGDRLKSYDDIKPAILKEKVLEQFFPYFIDRKQAEKDFRITIELAPQMSNDQKNLFPDQQSITNADIPDFECETFLEKGIDAFNEISMSYWIQQGMGEQFQLTGVSVDGRTIPIKLLTPNSIPLNCSAIFLFKSDLFTGKSDSSRQRLTLPEDIPEQILFRALRRHISAVLNERIPEIDKRNVETKSHLEERYPHLTGLFEEETIGLIDKDEAIEIAQKRFFVQQKDLLEKDSLDDVSFQKSLEISSRTLAEYIVYRELIIKRLRGMTEQDRESSVHELIVPRYKQYHQDALIDGIYNNNAWLLDDKFMSFRTILSESRMDEVISAITLAEDVAEDDGRPDICMIFSDDPAEAMKVDVVVIEIKRRKVDEKENHYASAQLVKRARKLVDHCPNIQRVWYFAIIEIDEEFSQLLQDMRWTPLFSKGRVFYQDFKVTRSDGTSVPTPTCILSYDTIISDAEARNHTFLEILRNDIKNAKRTMETLAF